MDVQAVVVNKLPTTVSGIVFAAIAPHCGLAIPEVCKSEELPLLAKTRKAMEELGRRLKAAGAETVVVISPHNLHLERTFGVIDSGSAVGDLSDSGYPYPPSARLKCKIDRDLSASMRESMRASGVPVVAVSYGLPIPSESVMPMDYATLVPLWFMGGRFEPPLNVVIVCPCMSLSRNGMSLSPKDHVTAGNAIRRAALESGKRVAIIASADHGHAHQMSEQAARINYPPSPFPVHPAAVEYDRKVVSLVETGNLQSLLAFDEGLIENAVVDSYWPLLMLYGAIGDAYRADLLSYEVPISWGMICASYTPAAGSGEQQDLVGGSGANGGSI